VTSGVNLKVSLGFSLGVRPTVEPRVGSRLNLTALPQMLSPVPRHGCGQRKYQHGRTLGQAARYDAGSLTVYPRVSYSVRTTFRDDR